MLSAFNQLTLRPGRRGLVLGLGGQPALALAVAQQLHAQGAQLVLACLHAQDLPRLQAVAQALDAPLLLCHLHQAGSLQALVEEAVQRLDGRLDFAVHALDWAPLADQQGQLTERSTEVFLRAMHRACHSFAELALWCEPHMVQGGQLVAVSNVAADPALRQHGLVGAVDAALGAMVRYLDQALGPQGIRVQVLSTLPSPLRPRSAPRGARPVGVARPPAWHDSGLQAVL